MRRLVAFLAAVLFLAAFPALPARAGGAFTETEVSGGGGTPMGVQIWHDDQGFHVMYGGVQKTLGFGYPSGRSGSRFPADYLVSVETVRDVDGVDVTVICLNVAFSYCLDGNLQPVHEIGLRRDMVDEDGNAYFDVCLCAGNSYSGSDGLARSYYITIRDGCIGDFVSSRQSGYGSPSTVPMCAGGKLLDDTFYGRRSGRLYMSAFYTGAYTVYCSVPVTSGGEVLCPANPVPAVAPAGGTGGYPHRTTFRMLTDGAVVYNTFYYDSSYMSGADEVSATGLSGKIRLDAVRLSDGTVETGCISAPQPLCYKSFYGTAYDIVYTNDDNLCDLLGIARPAEKYWDVAAQEWRGVSTGGDGGGGSTGGSGSSGTDPSLLVEDTASLSRLKNLSVKLVGEDALIDPVRFNDYYAGHISHDNALEDLNTPVWGLGNYITWDYDGILYEAGDGDKLVSATKNLRQVKLVVRAKFRIDGSTTKTLTYTLYDYGLNRLAHCIAVSQYSWKVSFHDLCLYFQDAYPEYVTDFPSQLQQLTYYLTPFYYSQDDGKYHYGSTGAVVQNVKSALANYSGGEWDGDGGGWSNVVETPSFTWDSSLGFFDNIAGFVSDLFSPLRNFAEQLGQIGGLFGKLFSFLPDEVSGYLQMVFVGCLVIGVVRWLRG